MSESPHFPIRFDVKLDGADAPHDFVGDLLAITVESSLHLPDVATIVLHDPLLRWVDAKQLEPGKTVQVFAGPDRAPLFDGEIVEIEPDYAQSTQRLAIRAFDRLHRLARGRFVRSFVNVTDGDVVQRLAREVSLRAEVGPTAQVHSYLFQANETNLAFLQSRAAALGYLLYVEGTTLHFTPPRPEGEPITLRWGETLSEFRPRLTTIDQVSGVTARGWDPDRRQEIVGQAQGGEGVPQVSGQRNGGELAQNAFHIQARDLTADRPIRTQAHADRLAQAMAERHTSRFIVAEGTCAGNPAILAGVTLQLDAVGTRFGGAYFVTSATHEYRPTQGYSITFSVSGQHPATLLSLLTPEPQPVPTSGLVIGVVTDNQDPEGQGRVKVKYPWLAPDQSSDWARVVVPGGGAERGIQFLPEINDEVLIGFELGDVHYPYVLGGLWNKQDAPPRRSTQIVSGGKVQQRIIRSRAGHVITLDDSEGGGGVTIQDRRGNRIVLDSGANALTVEAKGNLTLKAGGQVEIRGNGVTIDGGASTVDVHGSIINLN